MLVSYARCTALSNERGVCVLFERVKVGTASPATPDAICSKTIAMCKACNVPISDRTCPDLALLLCGLKYMIF